ncbi:MAG: AbrB/MazE/SpoVT family DNA-binding domain-containing protein [Oscillospiraceae bacterium]|jgi:transcriptional pleiotropic regulator of transition state genes|nr:AbrB/MazE/SpoVT family DNA-binding domain-containing protein [Oscillospiraceae bacterium]
MKSLGIVRQIDGLGRIVLPSELRRKLDIDAGNALEIYTEGRDIVLRKYQPSCVFCDSTADMKVFNGKNICAECQKAINDMSGGNED